MKLIALYRQDGRIIALSRVPQRTGGDAGIPMLRSGVAPGDGERVAIVDLEPSWEHQPLTAIHERFTIVDDGERTRLRERGERAI